MFGWTLDLVNIELIFRIIDDEISGSTLVRFLGQTTIKRIEGSDLQLKEKTGLVIVKRKFRQLKVNTFLNLLRQSSY